MAEIAAEAGLSPGAIYRYFENKEQLARGCLGENAHELEEQWKHAPEPNGDAMAEFARLSRLTFATLNEPGEAFHTMLMLEQILKSARKHDQSLVEIQEGFEHTRDALRQRLELVKDSGQFPVSFDPTLMAAGLFSFYLGARVCKLSQPDLDTNGQLEQLMGLLLASSPAAPAQA